MRVRNRWNFSGGALSKQGRRKDKPPPSEDEVRRFFQESYYTSMTYDSELGDVHVSTDRTGLIYPKRGDAI